MSDLKSITALSINGENLSLHDLLESLKVRGKQEFIRDVIACKLVRTAAAERGISASEDEIQIEVDRFRQRSGLNNADQTTAWLKLQRLTVDQLAQRYELRIIEQKLQDALTTGEEERYFENNRALFETAVISQLLFDREGAATTFREKADAALCEFHALARKCEDAVGPYFSGQIKRCDMERDIEAAVFAALPGDNVGPLVDNDRFAVIRIEELPEVELTDQLKADIRRKLFADWKEDLIRRAGINILLKDVL